MSANKSLGEIKNTLRRDVLESPREDWLRLVYADWCEDHGEPDLAEFIRSEVSHALAPNDATYLRASELFGERHVREACGVPGLVWQWGECYANKQSERIKWQGWNWTAAEQRNALGAKRFVSPGFHRGFACEIGAIVQSFLVHAEAVFRAHPIVRVHLIDLHPFDSGKLGSDKQDFVWHNDMTLGQAGWPDEEESSHVPGPIFRLLPPPAGHDEDLWRRYGGNERAPFYADEEEARLALSYACVAYGRLLAGLSAIIHAKGNAS